jgi:UDP-N-acetylmuramyl pentapeptide phosphotransferase/UDP-N-acetylglucosamine-1-phosphate transferase
MYLVLCSAWSVVAIGSSSAPAELGWIMAFSFVLAIVSGADDLWDLPMMPRLVLQIVVASLGTYVLGGQSTVFQGYLPASIDAAATVFVWVGFINLFNFTDGIDGNAGTKAAVLGTGIFLLAVQGVMPTVLGQLGITVTAVACGFLVWNWHPARIFMGDVGSVPLGFLLGWLLLRAAGEGQWAPAIILPLIYLSDTCVTYLLKILRRERFWHPHRDHFYQRAVQREGVTHSHVVKVILVGDVLLIAMATAAAQGLIWPALLGAGLTAASVITYLSLVHADGAVT